MSEMFSDTPHAGHRPLSPNTRQLIEDFIERMEAIQAEHAQALLIAAREAAGKKAEDSRPRRHRVGKVFPPVFDWLFPSLSPRPRRLQPHSRFDETADVIDVPYRVIDEE